MPFRYLLSVLAGNDGDDVRVTLKRKLQAGEGLERGFAHDPRVSSAPIA